MNRVDVLLIVGVLLIAGAILAAALTGAAVHLPTCNAGVWVGNYTGSAHVWCVWS